MSVRRWYQLSAWALWYEPSWFLEFGMAVAILGWSVGALLTDDFIVSGWGFVLPLIGAVFGPLRIFLLLRRWYGARMTAACLSAAGWGLIFLSLTYTHGAMPGQGPLEGLFVMDVLTILRFSIPAAHALILEKRRQA